jgi:hypothetical protein
MAVTKEEAKLEIKEIIEKIKRGESPSTSRAYELMDQFQLGSLTVEMSKAMEEAAVKSQIDAQGKNQETSMDPLQASKSFFDNPERKEMLEVHEELSKGSQFNAKKDKPGIGYITRNQLINSSNTAIKGKYAHKQHSERLNGEINTRLNQIKEEPKLYTNSTRDHLKNLLEEQLKHEKAIRQAELVENERKARGIETTEKLFKDNNIAASLTQEIAKEHQKMRQGVDNIISLVDSLYKAPAEKSRSNTQSTEITQTNFTSFKANTPVQYINSGKALTPDATPGAKAKSQVKAA